jgi:hypothetical protein
MANWSIENMERQQDTGLVTKVKWTVTFVKDMEFSNTNGVVELGKTDLFVPFEELTQTQVLNWVFEKIDKAEIESKLEILVDEKISAKASPKIEVSGLPWDN